MSPKKAPKLPKTMTAVEISAPGGPEALVSAKRPVPKPGEGEVLIKVAAAGVNRPDVLQRQGSYPPPAGASDIPGLEVADHLSLHALLDDLGQQGINNVLVEAGPRLNGALLEAGLVNELVVYQAPRVMGARAQGMFALETVERMADSIEFNLVGARRVGADLRLNYRMD